MLRWDDPLFPDSAAFDPRRQSAKAQLKQFGYNNHYIAFVPLDGSGSRALLCVNHEYTNEEVMFPGTTNRKSRRPLYARGRGRSAAKSAVVLPRPRRG